MSSSMYSQRFLENPLFPHKQSMYKTQDLRQNVRSVTQQKRTDLSSQQTKQRKFKRIENLKKQTERLSNKTVNMAKIQQNFLENRRKHLSTKCLQKNFHLFRQVQLQRPEESKGIFTVMNRVSSPLHQRQQLEHDLGRLKSLGCMSSSPSSKEGYTSFEQQVDLTKQQLKIKNMKQFRHSLLKCDRPRLREDIQAAGTPMFKGETTNLSECRHKSKKFLNVNPLNVVLEASSHLDNTTSLFNLPSSDVMITQKSRQF